MSPARGRPTLMADTGEVEGMRTVVAKRAGGKPTFWALCMLVGGGGALAASVREVVLTRSDGAVGWALLSLTVFLGGVVGAAHLLSQARGADDPVVWVDEDGIKLPGEDRRLAVNHVESISYCSVDGAGLMLGNYGASSVPMVQVHTTSGRTLHFGTATLDGSPRTIALALHGALTAAGRDLPPPTNAT